MVIKIKSFEEKFKKLMNGLGRYNPYIFLVLLTLIVSVITYYRVLIQIGIGPTWDTCDFLSNAIVFAGQSTGYADLVRPPFFAFLTSIFFRLGYLSSSTIFVLDGLIFVFGVMGFYMLLKIHFNDVESFLCSLMYVSFPIVLSFLGYGLSDLPSISFLIWAVYFTVLAVKQNSKFFYLAFPFLMIAFLTRYAAALIIFPLVFYIMVNREILKKTKDIVIGIFLSFILLLPFLIFFYLNFGSPFYSFSSFNGMTSGSSPVSLENISYHPSLLYFVWGLPLYTGKGGFATVLIILLGVLIYTSRKIRKNGLMPKRSLKDRLKVENSTTKIKLLIIAVLTILFIGTFGKTDYMVSEVLFLALSLLSYWVLKKSNIKDLDFHFFFISWFMVFFIFHSVYVIKDSRYFLTMAPSVAYFLVLGLSEISNRLNYKIRNRNVTFYFFALALTVMLLISIGSELSEVKKINSDTKIINENMEAASQWFKSYDPSYNGKVIYSDYCPYTGWYLRTNVKLMPTFEGNQTFYYVIKNYSFDSSDNQALNDYLKSNNVDYYFCVRKGINLTQYKSINQFGDVVIYEKGS